MSRTRTTLPAVLLSAAIGLSGCTLAPKYVRPPLPVADALPDESAAAPAGAPA